MLLINRKLTEGCYLKCRKLIYIYDPFFVGTNSIATLKLKPMNHWRYNQFYCKHNKTIRESSVFNVVTRRVTGTCVFEFYLWTNIQIRPDSLGLISIPLVCIHTHNYLACVYVWRWLTIKQSQTDKYVIWSKWHLNGTHFHWS